MALACAAGQQLPIDGQAGAQPPYRHPHLVDAFRVSLGQHAGFVGAHVVDGVEHDLREGVLGGGVGVELQRRGLAPRRRFIAEQRVAAVGLALGDEHGRHLVEHPEHHVEKLPTLP